MARTTVVVITHNRREELLGTLRHMTALPDRAPIVVVDNASSDGTADAVAAAFPQVTLIRGRANLASLGRNLAVRGIQSRYVAFCDDDSRWQAGALTRAADLLDAHPGLASVTARILVEPDLQEDPLTPELRNSPVPGPAWLPGPALLSVLAGATMFRVAAFRQVGGFSPRLWLGGEEELLAIDLAARGWWMCWAEDVVVHHAPSRLRDPGGAASSASATPCGPPGCAAPPPARCATPGASYGGSRPTGRARPRSPRPSPGCPGCCGNGGWSRLRSSRACACSRSPSAAPPPAATSAEPGRSAQPVPVWA